jgi:PTH1 family peptidyl-tRNA hydrolase
MKMIVGLGNPGKEYDNTRHNIGFMIIDNYVTNNDWKKKFEGLYQIITIDNEKVLCLKPQTFMNLSGNSVVKAANFYNIKPSDILVIQDDMDLPFKKFRLKVNSSSGGHNGIKSIINCLNTQAFCRLKIGISHDNNGDTINYVLGKFSKEELEYINSNFSVYSNIIKSFVKNGIEETMSLYNTRG